MKEFLTSTKLLFLGILSRYYIWVPALLTNPFDFFDKGIKPFLPPDLRWNLDLPPDYFPTTLWFLIGLSVIQTYHNLRMSQLSRISQESVDKLAELRGEGVQIYALSIRSQADLQVWKTNVNEWVSKTKKYLEDHFPKSDALYFTHLGSFQANDVSGSLNKEHNHQRLMLDERLKRLQHIIEKHS